MRKKIKDTDYLAISTRIKAMENGLLTREIMLLYWWRICGV